ncbi:MAG: type II toxin-antitoxin system HicA family toxin [Bacillota bacterium]
MGPVSRPELIRRLRNLGYAGPFHIGGRHPAIMIRDRKKLHIPNEHQSDIGVELLRRILKQAGISDEEWENSR